MARSLILETTFLVDLERDVRREVDGPALALLKAEADSVLYVTFTTAGVLAAGTSMARKARWEMFLSPFRVLGSTPEVSWAYGETYRFLSRNGLLIGTNDLWIAATAIAYAMPVVTRNTDHFSRVPGLDVVAYGTGSGSS